MPVNNPAAYADIARRYNASPSGAGGFQNILDDLEAFLGGNLAQRPEGFVGPPSVLDFGAEDRSRLARQAAQGNDMDMGGMQQAGGGLADLMALLRKMRNVMPDNSLARQLER